ncbi:hypothetical protein Tco_0986967 [Tanacetum coccineum]
MSACLSVDLPSNGSVKKFTGASFLAKIPTYLHMSRRTSLTILCWSSYARALIEVRANVELKDNIVVDMPKIVREGLYTCTIHIEYEWKPLRCACCKVFGHVQGKCPKNIDSDVMNNMKKPSQATRGVPVGPKVTFVDDEGKPLAKVDSLSDHESENEVALVDNKMEIFLASKKVGYGEDIPDKIQAICDNLDIKVQGRKKK